MRDWLSIYLKGIFMGIAEGIPGVSGGTIALITGIYERLVGAIAAFDPRVVADLPRAYDPDARGRVVAMLREMDVAFLAVLLAGMVTAIVGVTGGINAVRESNPAMLYAFFFGLIAASAVVLRSEFRIDTIGEKTAAVVGFAVAFLLSGVTTGTAVPHSPVVLFAAGALAISAMVLPGVSGAFLLLLFGQYEFMSETLHEFIDAAVAFVRGGPLDPALAAFVSVGSFVAGAAVGVLTFARVVEWALANHREATLTFLVALMVGALRLPVEKIVGAGGAWPVERAAAVLLAGAAGAAAVLLMDHFTDDIEYGADRAEPTPAPRND
jgi:putative membrane protein